jgi:hypothetical protein
MYDSGNLLSDGVDQYAIIHMTADNSSDLVGLQTYDTVKLLQGSTVIDISTGDKYMMKSDYTWVLQPNASQSVSIDIPDFDALETRMDTAEDRLDVAEDDISALESSDTKQTAAITELINTGGKNAAQINDGSGTRNMVIPLDIPAGDYVMYIGEITSTDTDASVCRIAVADASDSAIWTGGSTRGTEKIIEFTIASDAKRVYVYASDTYNHSSGDTVTITDFMICTKTDWDISQQYEPYCPKVDKLYAYVVSELSGINTLLGAGI